jgi:hypothetical protein
MDFGLRFLKAYYSAFKSCMSAHMVLLSMCERFYFIKVFIEICMDLACFKKILKPS